MEKRTNPGFLTKAKGWWWRKSRASDAETIRRNEMEIRRLISEGHTTSEANLTHLMSRLEAETRMRAVNGRAPREMSEERALTDMPVIRSERQKIARLRQLTGENIALLSRHGPFVSASLDAETLGQLQARFDRMHAGLEVREALRRGQLGK